MSKANPRRKGSPSGGANHEQFHQPGAKAAPPPANRAAPGPEEVSCQGLGLLTSEAKRTYEPPANWHDISQVIDQHACKETNDCHKQQHKGIHGGYYTLKRRAALLETCKNCKKNL
jgi:hypothetical protein